MAVGRNLEVLAREMRGTSPFRGSLLLAAILVFLAISVVWAAKTEINDVTRAEGRIVPSRDIQVIQATEPGVLQALFVNEGEIVAENQVLMELDGTQLDSQLDQEQQRAYGLMARIDRLGAQIEDRDLHFAPELVARAPEVVRSETSLYHGRLSELRAEIGILERQRVQRRQQLQEGRVELSTTQATLSLLAEERAIMQPLVERGVEPETTLLELRRKEFEMQGRSARAQAAISRLEAALNEIEDKIGAQRSRYQSAALSDFAVATAELAVLKPSLPALRDRAKRAKIRAPVRGIVNRIHRSTLGGLARSGEDLIEIVPLDDTLLVEAYVRPADIAFVYPGQPVKVKITAYDFSRYGSLDGEITRIGADAVKRSERDAEEHFVVQVRTDDRFLDADGVEVEIIPGMITEVDILAGRKTVLEYLTRPVVRVKERALRE
ncbi:MAG: HlyD family type I secretion periplasmic adaptor subunit [Sediminimonas qiaohouensis]|uniref:Membrane fusion protein (MFP) family protein n=1 Tax=Sediminimonas qiaohouensis TaxID=552061 RepID=A0A7C9L8A6_9RHOB|nr:HlyD family type I secretion periplasmic adaptor subunit [Sediminimonas qiaohouensis]MTJ05095.1 HlyD family type I secretion periplasmic adaptor subunit [Sediminimonas qiaohouensis]